ncbi:DoxX family protein [Micromonospora sp. NPDC023814]|uniref:DoxX family protein n=1 Tax=Micromonospora sp. NPDC023814 TaxID=3154596 RepID=UPI0033C1DE69
MTLPTTVRDVAMLLARIGVGIVFFAHGWQKLVTNGVDGTAAFFDQAGVPLPTLSAWFATGVELLGGAALVLGAAVPIAGVLLALDMLGAFIFVHVGNGLFVDKGGYELVLVLGAASLLLAAVGAGRLSVDHLLTGRRRAAEPAPAGRA